MRQEITANLEKDKNHNLYKVRYYFGKDKDATLKKIRILS
jgi:hypothetical protein